MGNEHLCFVDTLKAENEKLRVRLDHASKRLIEAEMSLENIREKSDTRMGNMPCSKCKYVWRVANNHLRRHGDRT